MSSMTSKRVAANGKPDGRPDAIAEVSRALLGTPVGARIPTVQDLQAQIGVGSGTVVKALRTLEGLGAVAVEAHGHLGTLLVDRNLGTLWETGRMGNLRILLTPPGPVEQHAVAAAIRKAMSEHEIPVLIDFVPGARRRLKQLAAGRAHAAFTSRGAFDQHESEYRGLGRIDLGEHTYYDSGSLLVVARTARLADRPQRVGIDVSSDDHAALTRAEFGEHVEHVECSFVEGPAGVLREDFDAVVWHRMPAIIPPELAGLAVRPLSLPENDPLLAEISQGVIVTRTRDLAVGSLLASVTPAKVRQHMRRLNTAVRGSVLPHEALWLG